MLSVNTVQSKSNTLGYFEFIFSIFSLIHMSQAIIPLIMSGGVNEGDGIDINSLDLLINAKIKENQFSRRLLVSIISDLHSIIKLNRRHHIQPKQFFLGDIYSDLLFFDRGQKQKICNC